MNIGSLKQRVLQSMDRVMGQVGGFIASATYPIEPLVDTTEKCSDELW